MSKTVELSGTIGDVFAHRFSLKTAEGAKLIDLGPGGERDLELEAGQKVAIRVEEKLSEVKANEIRIAAGEWRPVQAGGKPAASGSTSSDAKSNDRDDTASWMTEETVRRQLDEAGYTGHGDLVRKPKHVEVEAEKDGKRHTVHIHKDGVKKAEPVT